MERVATGIMDPWMYAATEHVDLRCMYETGYPYITVYIDGLVECSDHRILHSLYYAGGELRTSQAFVCSLGAERIDVINVHAPSGTKTCKTPPNATSY